MTTLRNILLRLGPLLVACAVSDGAEDDLERVTEPSAAIPRVFGLPQPVFVPQVPAFDQWIFGCEEKEIRWQLEQQIENRIVEMGVTYCLTEAQLSKLTLVASIELHHFFSDVDELRQHVVDRIGGPEFDELIERKRHLFDANSMFGKVATRIITAEQTVAHQQMIHAQTADRSQTRHRVNIDGVVREFERRLALRTFQKVQLIRLLLAQAKPPKVPGNFDDMVLKYRLVELADGRLKSLFDDDQWPRVCKILIEFQDFRPALVRYGLIDRSRAESGITIVLSRPMVVDLTDRSLPADATSPANRAED